MNETEVQDSIRRFFDIMKRFGEDYDSLYDEYIDPMFFIESKDGQYRVQDGEIPAEGSVDVLQDALDDYLKDPWTNISSEYLGSDSFDLKRDAKKVHPRTVNSRNPIC